jgi:6-phosphogluconolactonase (cycloisomerase 2 family)
VWVTQARRDLVTSFCRVAVIAVSVLAALVTTASAAAVPPPLGALTQMPGTLGCFSTTGASQVGPGTCQVGREIIGPESAVVSPDGRFLYVGSYQSNTPYQAGLAVFSRDPVTGVLTELTGKSGCYTMDGSSQAGATTCTEVRGMGVGDGRDFVMASGGQWAYMVNQRERVGDPAASIIIFRRNPATGVLSQPAGTAGCLSVDGSSQAGPGTCQTLATLAAPNGISISSNNRFVYVNDYGAPARLHVLRRNLATGALTEVQCLAAAPAPTGCTASRGVGSTKSLVISPDGTHAYSALYASSEIAIWDRNPSTGLLTEKMGAAGCISVNGEDNNGAATCATGRELINAEAMSITPDGHTLYVASYGGNGLAIFHVNANGTLSQLSGPKGCVSEGGIDNLGKSTCADVRALQNPYGSTISPDGRTLYVTEFGVSPEGGVAVFSINPSSGALTQLPGLQGCVTADGASNAGAGTCQVGAGLGGTYDPIVSPDGESVYIAGENGQALSVFERETAPTCAAAIASTVYERPVSVPLSCIDGDGQAVTISIASAPSHGKLGPITDGAVTYTPVAGFTGHDSFTFEATDGTNVSSPATVTITVKRLPRPVVSHAGESHPTWSEVAAPSGEHPPPVGTTFNFTLNETAQVTFTFAESGKGQKGTLTVTGRSGQNKVAFQGRLNAHHKLATGSYAATIVARNEGGASKPAHLSFTIAG